MLAYHHQFARADYQGCLATCNTAIALLPSAGGAPLSYCLPFESSIAVPAGNLLHWQYLSALAAVMIRAGGQALSPSVQLLLDNEPVWQKAFLADDRCCWTYSEEYEGGGGDDFPVPPYDIDLRISERWENPVRDRDLPFQAFVMHAPD